MVAITDKFSKTFNSANPNVATVTGTRTALATTLACDNLAGWPTDTVVHFSTYQIDTESEVVSGTQTDWKGLVSGNNIGTLTRVAGEADSGNAIGDIVEMNPTANWATDLAAGILVQHKQDGTHANTITTDTVNENTAANGVTIDGLNIKDSKLVTANSVVTANVTNAAITPDKLGLGPQTATVATSESTAGTSFTDLATAGPAVTVTIGANGVALVSLYAALRNATAGSGAYMGFGISGANTVAASTPFSIEHRTPTGGGDFRGSAVFLLTGLTPGSTTFTAKYRVSANTGHFEARQIAVVPL